MRLYFLRHGIAVEPGDWQGSDGERPLTKEGQVRVKQIGQTMSKLALELQAIVTSPAVRARQTADLVAQELKTVDLVELEPRLLSGFDLKGLTAMVRAHSSLESLLLVGHEPDFSEVIGTLIGGGRIQCKKASLICVELSSYEPLAGTLVWLLPPKFLARPW
jgi:phosphohistidine phosphatase